MDCYICNKDSYDENHCELCRFEVYPIQDWMRDKTGGAEWTDSNIPFMQIHNDHANMIAGFIAGGQMPFKLIDVGSGLNCLKRLIRIDLPEFTYVPFSEAL